ncbi:14668_t:CDS:2, partial [Dentiscutata erythropus]
YPYLISPSLPDKIFKHVLNKSTKLKAEWENNVYEPNILFLWDWMMVVATIITSYKLSEITVVQ